MTEMEKTARKNKFKGIARRDFLKIAGLIGLGLTLEEALSACGATPLETPTSAVIAETAQPTPTEIPPTPDQVLEQYRKLIEEKGNSYVRILSAKARAEGAPLEEKLKTFVNKLIAGRHIEQAALDIYQSEEEAKAAGTSYSLGNINPYGAPYIAFFDEKTRRAGFIFDVWESDKPLIATKEDAWEVFSNELASNTEYANFVSEKTGTSAESLIPDDFHLTAETNRLADLVFTPTGEAFIGVNHLTQRWEFIDHLGGLAAVPVTAAQIAETPEKKPEGVALSDEALVTELVNYSKETNTYPTGLTDEQEQAWFEELNRQCDLSAFIFEIPNNNSDVLIHVPKDICPNFGDLIKNAARWRPEPKYYSESWIVPKTALNDATLLEIVAKIAPQKWIPIKVGVDGIKNKKAFYDERSSRWVNINGSENIDIEFWNKPEITAEEIDPKTDEAIFRSLVKADNKLTPFLLAPIPEDGLDRLLAPSAVDFGQGDGSGLDLLKVIRVKTIKDELGNSKFIGETVFLPTVDILGYFFAIEEQSKEVTLYGKDTFKDPGKISRVPRIQVGGVYYVAVSRDLTQSHAELTGGKPTRWLIADDHFMHTDQIPEYLSNPIDLKSQKLAHATTDMSFGPSLTLKKL